MDDLETFFYATEKITGILCPILIPLSQCSSSLSVKCKNTEQYPSKCHLILLSKPPGKKVH